MLQFYLLSLFIFKNIKVVLDHIDAVEDGDDGHHEADAEPQQHRAVAPAVHIAVQHQVVHRGGCQGEHEDRVSYKPGDQQGAQGDKETKEQEQVGHQTNCIRSKTHLVQYFCCKRGEAGTKIMAMKAQDRQKRHRDGHSVDGHRQHAL